MSGDNFSNYCSYIHDSLSVRYSYRWHAASSRHRAPIQHARVASSCSVALKSALSRDFAWNVLIGQRAVARLRCGLVSLGHRDGNPSCAATQCCVFCNCSSSSMWAHVFAVCPRWSAQRQLLLVSSSCPSIRPWDVMYFIVGTTPANPDYEACVLFIADVVADALRFWRDSGCGRM